MPDSVTPTKDVGKSLIRTVTPFVTAWVAAYVAQKGFDIDPEVVSGEFVTLAGAVWYSAVRFLEQRWPKAGWLLGVAEAPVYEDKK